MISSSQPIEYSARLNNEGRGIGFLLIAWLLTTMSLWVFAFYSVPATAPDWVRRAQVACFGSNESGMPGASGWMVLILSPGGFLAAILVVFLNEAKQMFSKLLNGLVGRIWVSIICFLVLAEVLWVWDRMQEMLISQSPIEGVQGLDLPETYPRGTNKAPDFSLIDQHGRRLQLSSALGKPVILSFVFAHCQAVCPGLIKTISASVKDFLSGSYKVMLVTLDPWRDTPASLPDLAKSWNLGPDSSILSASPEEVNSVLDAYGIPRQRDDKNGDVIHPALVTIISPDGKLAYSFNNPSTQWIRAALARVKD